MQLPIIILIDTSGSMYGDKIMILNNCVTNMVKDLQKMNHCDLSLAIITYATKAEIYQSLVPIKKAQIDINFKAGGKSNLGMALELLSSSVLNTLSNLENACLPEIILISDGSPTDDWRKIFNELLKNKIFALARRHALFIGDDDGLNTLQSFLGSKNKVFKAHEHLYIKDFFTYIKNNIQGFEHDK